MSTMLRRFSGLRKDKMANIRVYSISIPEYKIKIFKKVSNKTHYSYWGNPVPKEYEENKPDFELISSKIIKTLRKHFMGRKIGLRLLGSMEHQKKRINDLIKIIKQLGHDRYDPNRIGDRYENIGNKKIDLFALDFVVGKKKEEESVKSAIESFYYYPIFDRKTPIRVDIGIVYDLSQLKVIKHQYAGRENELKKDGFVFKHPDKKPDAILGIIKIL